MYKRIGVPGTKMSPVKYKFKVPKQVRTIKNGNEILMGYGIGDIIEVMYPEVCFAVACYEKLEPFELADGTIILNDIDENDLETVY